VPKLKLSSKELGGLIEGSKNIHIDDSRPQQKLLSNKRDHMTLELKHDNSRLLQINNNTESLLVSPNPE